jgi:hypothetical protein
MRELTKNPLPKNPIPRKAVLLKNVPRGYTPIANKAEAATPKVQVFRDI